MRNLLATVRAELGGLGRVARVVKVEVFGDTIGRPARSAIGVAALPLGFAVEIEL